MLNLYVNKAYTQIQTNIEKIKIEKLSVSQDIVNLLQKSSQDILIKISNSITKVLTNNTNNLCLNYNIIKNLYILLIINYA